MKVTGAVKDILGVGLAVDAPLMASGLDSLGATDLRKGLIDKTGLELPTTLVFDYPTISALSDYMHSKIAEVAGPASAQMALTADAPRAVLDAQPDVLPTRPTGLLLVSHPIPHMRICHCLPYS